MWVEWKLSVKRKESCGTLPMLSSRVSLVLYCKNAWLSEHRTMASISYFKLINILLVYGCPVSPVSQQTKHPLTYIFHQFENLLAPLSLDVRQVTPGSSVDLHAVRRYCGNGNRKTKLKYLASDYRRTIAKPCKISNTGVCDYHLFHVSLI